VATCGDADARTSWTAPLDAVRLGPADDETEVTAAQVREVVGRLAAAGRWRPGDEDILVVFDAGYDVTRLAWLLADLPVELCGRLRSDRVLCELPVIESTLIQLTVDHLPGDSDPKPVWLCPRPPALIPLRWTAYGRRSCAGLTWNTPSACSSRHSAGPSRRSAIPPPTGGPGWSSPATPSCASLARPPAADLRRPWEKPAPPGRLTPARVRRGKPPPSAHPQRRQDQHEDLTTALGTQPTISTGP